MRIDLGCLAALKPQQLLDITQVNPFFKQMGGKTVSERMNGPVWIDAAFFLGQTENFLYAGF